MASENKAAFTFVFSYVKHYWHLILVGFFTILLASILEVFVPFIVGTAIDYIRATHTATTMMLPPIFRPFVVEGATPSITLLHFALILAVVVATLAVVRIISRITVTGIARHVEYDMLNDFLRHLQKMSQRFFQTNKTGDLMALATNDIPAIRRMTGPGITQLLSTAMLFALALYFMLNKSVMLTLVGLIPLPIVVVIVASRLRKIHSLFGQMQEQFSKLTSRVQENFSGIRVIKSYVRERFEIAAFEEENREYIKRNMALAKVDAYMHAWLEFLLGFSFIAVLWFGGRQIMNGLTTLGDLVALLSYVGMLAWPMISVGWLIDMWQRGLTAAQRVQLVLNEPVQILDTTETNADISHIDGAIEFKNVSFTFPGTNNLVLDNISLRIAQGQKLAIVGPTGCGKSTFVHLLPRLLEPTQGSIYIDGHNIKSIPLQLLRQSIGFVQQESFLFSDTIAENISFGVIEPLENIVAEAAEISQLKLDIDQFPDGLQTLIGERGITLSGGQKQRTSISRAVIKNPKILVLDDALSAVDTYTEDEILNRIRPIMNERTTIIVAHRISTIRDADHIIVLSDGKIVEQGTHWELLDQQGLYFDMYERQKLEENLRELK